MGWEWGKGSVAWRHALMPPFHDTRFWNHALIGQMSSCWQIRGAVDSIVLFLCQAPTIWETIQISLWDFLLIPQFQEEQKIYLWSVRRRKPKHSKCGAFLILSCDKQLWSNQFIYAKNACFFFYLFIFIASNTHTEKKQKLHRINKVIKRKKSNK